ncbi:aminodeoxychorismate lyase [Staphylococcus chromogenes]|nr:aminodeoxychorismate lyase [Staphylococcus chromogenes]
MSSPRLQPLIYALEPFGGSTRSHLPSLPLVYVDDTAVTRGEGVFETLRLVDGHAENVERHIARFQRSAQQLGIPEPRGEQWAAATAEAAAEWELQHTGVEATCRWTLTRGRESRPDIPTAWMVVQPLSPAVLFQREHGVKVLTGPRGYRLTDPTPWSVSGAKSLGYAANMSALRYANSQGFDDVIFLDGDRVLEATTATVITFRGHKVRTPVSGADVLPGTTVASLFADLTERGFSCKEKPLLYDDLLKADSVWLVSSLRGATRVTKLDEHTLAGSKAVCDFSGYLKRVEGGR